MLHVFIINSFAGKGDFSDNIREELSKIDNIEYLVFNSEYPGHETVVAKQIYDLFPDETIRFYVCGGSGTFRNVMKGLDNFDRVEFAEVPYGASNDFLSVYGDKRENFKNIKDLIYGKVTYVDYISTNVGPAHNTLSAGFDTKFSQTMEKYANSFFSGGKLLYLTSLCRVVLADSSINGKIYIDGEECEGKYMEIICSIGTRFGAFFTISEDTSVTGGYFKMLLIPKRNFFKKMYSFIGLITNNRKMIDKYCISRNAKSVEIYLSQDSKSGCGCNFDGEIEKKDCVYGKVVQKGLKYVLPRGLEVNNG